MHRMITALIDRQSGWATPLAEWAQDLLGKLFDGRTPLKNALNGTWLGHPVHPVFTDVPVGAMTVAAVLDLAGQETAADIAVATGVAAMTASAVTGLADGVDTYGRPQVLRDRPRDADGEQPRRLHGARCSCGSARAGAGRWRGVASMAGYAR